MVDFCFGRRCEGGVTTALKPLGVATFLGVAKPLGVLDPLGGGSQDVAWSFLKVQAVHS